MAICFAVLGCDVIIGHDTPKPRYTRATYVDALRAASLRTRGRLPTAAEEQEVQTRGVAGYEELIDVFLDPAQTPELLGQIRTFFLDTFEMPDQIDDEGGTPINNAEPANLATFLFLNDRPLSELVTSPTCYDNALEPVACTGAAPIPSGLLTNQPFLRAYSGSTLGFRRVSVLNQLLGCGVVPEPTDEPLRECNSCGMQGGGGTTLPLDDPPQPYRLHKKYQGVTGPGDCVRCHSMLNARRTLYAKYDAVGAFVGTGSIRDFETPSVNEGKCIMIPPGYEEPGTGGVELTPCCTNFADPNTCLDTAAAMAEPGGCCWHPLFADLHGFGSFECGVDTSACLSVFFGSAVTKPGDVGKLLVDDPDAGFAQCISQRLFAFALDAESGVLGLNENEGIAPARPPTDDPDATVDALAAALRTNDAWDARALLSSIFKSEDFLDTFL